MGEAPRRLVPNAPADFESAPVALPEDEETLVLSAVGEWSAADIWVRATDEAWAGAVRVSLYARAGGSRVLLQSKMVDEGSVTVEEGELAAFVMSHRGPRVSAFEVCLWTADDTLAGTGVVTLRAWSNDVELPYLPSGRYPSDVQANGDTVVRRDGDGRARLAGVDVHGPSILWDADEPSATIGWSAPDPSGAGGTTTFRGQQGASGSVGGSLTVGGGPGGTSSENTGDTVVELGPQVGVRTAGLSVASNGTQIGRLSGFAGTLSFRAGTGLGASGNVGRIGLGLETHSFTVSASLGQCILSSEQADVVLACGPTSGKVVIQGGYLATACTITPRATGASSVSWAQGIASLTDSIAQRTTGAGVTRSIEGQRGAAGSAGGNVVVAAGEGGTAGTNSPGNVVVDLRTPVSNVSGRQQWSAGGNVVAQLYQSDVDTTSLRIGSGNIGDGATGAKALAVEASSVTMLAASGPLVLFPAAGDLHLSHAAGEHILHKEGTSTVLREQLDADGATSLELVSGATSWAVGQESRSSGVGATHAYTAQATTASGQAGGGLSLRGGSGDPGGVVELLGGAGNVSNDGHGGHAHIAGGPGGGSGIAGNVALCSATSPGSWAAMSRGLFVGNAVAEPTASPSNGHFVYSQSDGSLQAINGSHLKYGIVPRGGPSTLGEFTFDSQVARVTTNNATATSIASRTMVSGTVYQVDVYAVGWNSGAGNQVGSYRKAATFKRSSGGTSAQVGNTELICREQEDHSSLDVTIAIPGGAPNDIVVSVHGLIATGITWIAEIHWRIFKP